MKKLILFFTIGFVFLISGVASADLLFEPIGSDKVNWNDANSLVSDKDAAEGLGWRLATVDELLTLDWDITFWSSERSDDLACRVNPYLQRYDMTGINNIAAFTVAVRDTSSATHAPEPASMLLLGSGILGLVGFRKKFMKTQ